MSRHRQAVTIIRAVIATAMLARGLAAQPPVGDRNLPMPAPSDSSEVSDATPAPWWRWLLGEREPDRAFAGMWTLHLQRPEDGLSQHALLAASWRGVYAATFISSHDRRCWGLALGRSLVRTSRADGEVSLGYRVGVVHGYDERLHDFAAHWPVLPAAELVGAVRYKRVGVAASYAGIVAYLTTFVSLGTP